MIRDIEEILRKWKDKKNRLPLIVRGARQVGKSFILEKFGKDCFDSLLISNFELNPNLKTCFENLDPQSICARLEVVLGKKIIPGKTLLFLDEIQNCPQAITALRYFYEKMPDLHVVAAGSLLEFTLNDVQFSFPVGRVQFLYLRPLSFNEYLRNSKPLLFESFESISLKNPPDLFFHNEYLSVLKEYFLIGGMPSVVRSYLSDHSFLDCQILLKGLIEAYRADFPKYASKAQYKYLQLFFDKVPSLVCKIFKYSQISQEYQSRELKVALEQLIWAGLINKVIGTSATSIPLKVNSHEHRMKLLFLDIGLVNASNQFDLETVWTNNLIQSDAGSLAEQFVGQELLAYSEPYTQEQLFFWERDKKNSSAEVDYVIQIEDEIIPIEVKAGKSQKIKSLMVFMDEKHSKLGVRISLNTLSLEGKILSVPLYMINKMPELIKSALQQLKY